MWVDRGGVIASGDLQRVIVRCLMIQLSVRSHAQQFKSCGCKPRGGVAEASRNCALFGELAKIVNLEGVLI